MLKSVFSRTFKRGISSSNLRITINQNAAAPPSNFHSDEYLSQLAFGTMTTPHILEVDWSAENGWDNPKIMPFDDLKIHPAAPCLHYALQCFEGMKAFYQEKDDKVVLFRPDMNAKRFRRSSKKIALPDCFEQEELVKCIQKLVDIDRDWVPKNKNGSLYRVDTLSRFKKPYSD